jgi:adenylate cyclase class 2
MTTEFEAKFLEIDTDDIRAQLTKLGATLVFADKTFERYNFDFEDMRLQERHGWVRLRAGEPDGNWTLCYKQVDGHAVDSVKEVEFRVESRDLAKTFLEDIGMHAKSHQERKREQWKLGNVEFDIDTWPWIPTFLEIEAPSGEEVQNFAQKLGLDFSKAVFGPTTRVYDLYGFEHVNSVPELLFSVPAPHEPKNLRA